MRELLILTSCLVFLLVYLAFERVRLGRALRRVPRRIAVTGTRGKSGVVRLVAAGLRESGVRVLAKTTGSKPVLIFPDGSESELPRPGGPSIREQVRLVSLAAKTGADTLVCEMMSIGAECLAVESRRILRPGTLILTNVRLDHLDEMGRRKDETARAFASAIPEHADIFVPEEELYPVFEETAELAASHLRPVVPSAAGTGPGPGPLPPFGEFEPNARLALDALMSLGVDGETAIRGMARAAPDFGGLKIWGGRFGTPPRPAVCVSAFAANEPESSALVLEKIRRRFPLVSRALVGLLSLREDRGDRTLQWVRAAGEGFFREFALVVLLGQPARAALRKIGKLPDRGNAGFFSLEGSSPGEMMNHVFSRVAGEPVVVGLGNIVGPGERIVRYWEEKGTPCDH